MKGFIVVETNIEEFRELLEELLHQAQQLEKTIETINKFTLKIKAKETLK